MHSAQEEESSKQEQVKRQNQEDQDKLDLEKSLKEAVFNESNFWKVEEAYSLDDLLSEYES